MYRRPLLIWTFGTIAGLFLIPCNPVNSTIIKLAFLTCVVGAWAGLLILTWRWKPMWIALLTVPLLLAIPFILPGSRIEGKEVRDDYVRRLVKMEGTKYIWGGESHRGIDCSGLPRRALRDALLAYGIRHANGKAFRAYLEQWWFDASARALGEGYRHYTQPIGRNGTIREMDYSKLLPGDLAVTLSGIHVLVYMGEERWIQADPGIGRVALLNGRKDENEWFNTPVTVHRWQLISQQ